MDPGMVDWQATGAEAVLRRNGKMAGLGNCRLSAPLKSIALNHLVYRWQCGQAVRVVSLGIKVPFLPGRSIQSVIVDATDEDSARTV